MTRLAVLHTKDGRAYCVSQLTIIQLRCRHLPSITLAYSPFAKFQLIYSCSGGIPVAGFLPVSMVRDMGT